MELDVSPFDLKLHADPARRCGDCQLCCQLLPMAVANNAKAQAAARILVGTGHARAADYANMAPDYDKPAGEVCRYQREHKGCSIYANRPFGCRTWSCRWLTNQDTADLPRPDRSHYVVDAMPDYVTVHGNDGAAQNIPVIIVWCDPALPDAHRDPALRAYLERRSLQGYAALVRYSERDALMLWPPALTDDGQWQEQGDRTEVVPARDAGDIFDTVSALTKPGGLNE